MGAGAGTLSVYCHSCGTRSRGDVQVCPQCGNAHVERTDGRYPVGEGASARVESITVVADAVDEENGLLLRVAPRLVYRPIPDDDEVPLSPAAKSLVDRLKVQPYSDESTDDLCVICSCTFLPDVETVTLECRHTYHSTCIKTWLEAQHTCPTCRYELEVDEGKYLRSIGLIEQASVVDADKMRQAKMSADIEAEERTRWWQAMCRGLPVHFGIQCTLCKRSPIVGTTYQCCLCDQASYGVYLCEDCYGLEVPNSEECSHEGEHLFLPRRVPAVGELEEESTAGAAYMAVRSLALAPLYTRNHRS